MKNLECPYNGNGCKEADTSGMDKIECKYCSIYKEFECTKCGHKNEENCNTCKTLNPK